MRIRESVRLLVGLVVIGSGVAACVGGSGSTPGTGGASGTAGALGAAGTSAAGGTLGTDGAFGTGGTSGTDWASCPLGSNNGGRFVASADGLIVTDTCTGLVWQRDGSGPRAGCIGDGYGYPGGNLTCTWDEAQAYCAGLALDGTGWSLPTLTELQSIVDDTVTYGASINQTAFPNTRKLPFWTSSPYAGSSYAGSSGVAWIVDFGLGGFSSDALVDDFIRVRCVRSGSTSGTGGASGTAGALGAAGSSAAGGTLGTGGALGTGGTSGTDWASCPVGSNTGGRFVVSADELTVTDTCTGLVWQRNGPGPRPTCIDDPLCTGVEAQAYCTGLTLDGSGWRLPTLTELQSIVDTTVAIPPTINQTAFPGTPSEWFWTSSPLDVSFGDALVVDFGDGSSNGYDTGYWVLRVRCVR